MKIFDWCLPKFAINNNNNNNDDTIGLFEWQAQRINNYMKYLMTMPLTPAHEGKEFKT